MEEGLCRPWHSSPGGPILLLLKLSVSLELIKILRGSWNHKMSFVGKALELFVLWCVMWCGRNTINEGFTISTNTIMH